MTRMKAITNNQTEKGKKWLLILAGVILILMGIIAISGINKPHLSPFTNKVYYEQPSVVAVSDDYKAVVDSLQKRLLILDSDDRLLSIVDMHMTGSPVNKITDVCIKDRTIYLLGYSVLNEGTCLTEEKVLTYDVSGIIGEPLYKEMYDKDSKISTPYYSGICIQDDQILLTGFRDKEVSLKILDDMEPIAKETNSKETADKETQDKETKELTEIWSAQATETVCTAVFSPSTGKIYAMGRSGNTYEGSLDKETFSRTSVEVECTNPGVLSRDFALYDSGFLILNILYWLSVLLVVLFFLALLLWLLKNKITSKGKIIALLVAAILFTAIFYSVSNQKSAEAMIHEALISGGKQMGIMMSEHFGDDFASITDQGVEEFCKDLKNRDTMDAHQDLLRQLAEADSIGKGMIISLNLMDSEGNIYSYVDSKNQYPAGQVIELNGEELFALEDYEGASIVSLKGSGDWVIYYYSYIYDSKGAAVGVLNVGCLRGNMDYYLWQNTLNLFITLTCILIAIITLISLVRTFSNDIRRMRSRTSEDAISKAVDMCGMFYFLFECIYCVDSAILVYVAKSLCVGMSPSLEAIMVALPLSAYFVGGFLGCLGYSRIVKGIGERLLSIISCVAVIMSFGLMIWALQSQDILLLSAGKLVEGFFLNGIIFSLGEMIPFWAKDDQVKRDAMNSTVRSAASAGVISILIGGILATVFSYQVMYAVGILMSVLLLLLSFRIFKARRGKHDEGNETKDVGSLKGSWCVFLKPPMLICMFLFLLPISVLDGYTNYLFPMYTAGAGISALLLSNLSVFSKTLTYGLNKKIDGRLRLLNKNTALILPSLIFSIGLVCFFFSPNIYWGIVMYLISDMVSKLSRSHSKLYLMDISREYHVDNTAVQAHFKALNSALKSCRGPILSLVVTLGMNLACSVVGLVNGAAMAGFGVYLKKRDEKKGVNENRLH